MKLKFYFLKFFLFISLINFAQTQNGIGINGEAAFDESGRSVSLSAAGNLVVIGAPFNDEVGSNSGHARVYVNVSGTWIQRGGDINGFLSGDNFGHSVSVSPSGQVVAVGAPFHSAIIPNSGQVKVYSYGGLNYSQVSANLNGEAANDNSGFSVSLSNNDRAAVGAPLNDGNGADSGHVRVYSFGGSLFGLDIDGEAAGDQSGYSVSLSNDGTTVAIGAPFNDGNGANSGHVRVYKYSGVWTKIGSDIDGEAAGDNSGHTVSLSADGSVVAIGAPLNDGNGFDSGHVRVFRNISGVWTQIGSDINGEAANDRCGYSVSLSADGSVLAIGAIRNGGSRGHVRVYQNILGTWVLLGNDIDGEASGDQSGYSVSLSSNGTILANGANFNDGNGLESGHVRMFDLTLSPLSGSHLNLDGSNDYVKAPVVINPSTTNFTFEINVYPTDLAGNPSIIQNTGKFNLSILNGNLFAEVWSDVMTPNIKTFKSTTAIALNAWTHIAVTWDNVSDSLLMYLNGSLVSTTNAVYNDEFIIGGYINREGAVKGMFKGNIDEVRVFDRVLSQGSIQDTRLCELQSGQTGLIAYYKFNQGIDSSDNTSVTTATAEVGSNALLNNFSLTGPISNWKAGSPYVMGNTCATLAVVNYDNNLDDATESNFKIYPNPTQNEITIEFKTLSNGKLDIYDINGRLIQNQILNQPENKIDISNFTSGIYLFKISSIEGTSTVKVVKQ